MSANYTRDILESNIVYESSDYVLTKRGNKVIIYHLCNYKTPFGKDVFGWLSSGSWYLRSDGTYFDSANYYDNGLGVASSLSEIIEKKRGTLR